MTLSKISGILAVLMCLMFVAACGRDDTEDRASAQPTPLNESASAQPTSPEPEPAASAQDIQSATPSELPRTASQWVGCLILGLAFVGASIALRYVEQ